jgi:acyl-CoA reductase-like NAD-dependent aldehyde dehydrogenase
MGVRLRTVRAARNLLVEDQAALCAAVEQDLGKPAPETIACELLPLAEAWRYLEKQARRLLRSRRVPLGQLPYWLFYQSDTVHRRPRGLVGIIGTWNYPLFLNGVQIVQALAAGNAVLWKPSEVARASARALAGLLHRAGFSEELFQVLPATREMGRQLAEADIDHIIFTGHADTGRVLASALGKRLVTSTLELSGSDAMFVLDDADLALAARAAWFGVTLNRGQTCLAVRRVFVARQLQDRFLQALAPLAANAQAQTPAMPVQARQGEQLVQEALERGARLLHPRPAVEDDQRFHPAVLVDVQPEMAVCHEASFVPLVAVLPFDQLDEALAAEARCPYALGASIFSGDTRRAARLAARLRAGAVTINDVIAPTGHPATPFGGRGASGWGVTQGAEGLLEMTVAQVVSVRSGKWRPHYDPPGSTPVTTLPAFQAMLRWGHAARLRDRLGGLGRLLRILWRGNQPERGET